MKKLILGTFIACVMSQAGCDCWARSVVKAASGNTAETERNAVSSPEESGMRSSVLYHIDSIVKDGLRAKAYPGCQVLVVKGGKTVYDKSFGYYTYDGQESVTSNTIYDLASLSKTTGTLLAVMKLYDTGKLRLTDKISDYLSALKGTDKENITITELLFHESGLPASLPFYKLAIDKNGKVSVTSGGQDNASVSGKSINQVVGPRYIFKSDWVSKFPSAEFSLQVSDSFFISNRIKDSAIQMIAATPLRNKSYVYSCVNFILLKEIVERISRMPMDSFLYKEFYSPLRLRSMSYLPLRFHKRDEIAPTLKQDFLRNGVIRGFVHDPDAAFLGGVSGNAGLFANAHDVAAIYQMLLNKGVFNGKRFLSEETCRLFTTTTSPSGRRGLGFDKPVVSNPTHSPCCASAPAEVYGHTGYTGTCCWVDPVHDLVYVFLSNRTYPDDGVNRLAKMGIRTKIQEVIYQSLK